jgi:MFS family permease
LIVYFGIRETRPVEAEGAGSTTPRERLAQLKSEPILLLFSLLALFFGIVYMQGFVTLPVDMGSHGLGPEQYGLAIAINGFLIVLISIPVSNIAGHWPRFEAMAASAVLLGLGFGFTALARSFPLFAISVGIWTLGEIAASAVAPAIIADLAPVKLRGLYQGIFGSSWGMAFFIGPLLGGWVFEHLGAGLLWGGCLALGLLLALGFLAMRAPARRRMEKSAD